MDTEEPGARGSYVLVGLVVTLSVVAFVLAVSTGRVDSAILFVGLPTLLALAVAVSPSRGSPHLMTFKGITIALLMAAVFLHEGAICVLLAAPLVYAVGHAITAIVTYTRRRLHLAVVPLALLLGAEGVVPSWRVDPHHEVSATHVVAAAPGDIVARVAAGPRLDAAPRPWLLTGMPVPQHVGGAGIDPGDQWVFHFHGDAHGPGGVLVTEVAERTPDSVRFRVVSDSSITARWLHWREGTLRWHAVDGATEVTLRIAFTRRLDPSWYFGPLDELFTDAAAGYLLDALGLPDRS